VPSESLKSILALLSHTRFVCSAFPSPSTSMLSIQESELGVDIFVAADLPTLLVFEALVGGGVPAFFWTLDGFTLTPACPPAPGVCAADVLGACAVGVVCVCAPDVLGACVVGVLCVGVGDVLCVCARPAVPPASNAITHSGYLLIPLLIIFLLDCCDREGLAGHRSPGI